METALTMLMLGGVGICSLLTMVLMILIEIIAVMILAVLQKKIRNHKLLDITVLSRYKKMMKKCEGIFEFTQKAEIPLIGILLTVTIALTITAGRL